MQEEGIEYIVGSKWSLAAFDRLECQADFP